MMDKENQNLKDFYKYIIIGAGPAGLQCAYYLQNVYHQDYIVIEMNSTVGSFFKTYPRLKKLISINKSYVYNFEDTIYDGMRFDWNSLLTNKDIRFKNYSNDFYPKTEQLLTYLESYATEHNLYILFDTKIISISRNLENGYFIIKCTNINYIEEFSICCEHLILSTGLKEKQIPLSIHSIANELNAKIYSYGTYSLDLEYYKGKNIVIVGTGNAAFETADYLNNVAMSIAMIGPTKLAWKTHYPGHVRSVNMNFVDTFYLKMGNVMYLDKYDTIHAIQLQNTFLKYCNSKIDIIIYCGGFECNIPFLDDNLKLNLDLHNYPILTPWYESVNISKLYIAGAMSHSHDYKKGSSGFIHGYRYNIEFLMKYINNAIIPNKIASKEELKEYIIRRLNYCSCLHHRHGYYGDYIIIKDTDIWYYDKIHIPYIKHIVVPEQSINITILFEYGDADFSCNSKEKNTFNKADIVIPFRNEISKFLHPVFKITFKNGKTDTCHVGESPTGQFFHPIHTSYVNAIIDLSYTERTVDDYYDFEKKIIDIHKLLI